MKYLTATLFFIFVSFCAVATPCEVIFSNDQFQLCAEESLAHSVHDSAYYDIYAIHRQTNEKTFISHELMIDDVANVIRVSEREYFYKAFIGGNSPPSEQRHVLLIVNEGVVTNGGIFSGYEDIDMDNKDDYFLLELTSIGAYRALDQYSKVKLIVRDNKLVVLK